MRGWTNSSPTPMGGSASASSRLLVALVALATVTMLVPTAAANPAELNPAPSPPSTPAEIPVTPFAEELGEPEPLIREVPQEVVDGIDRYEEEPEPLAFPPAVEPTIRPGRQLVIDYANGGGGLCTMNFVYQVQDNSSYEPADHQPELDEGDYLIGTAGHCVLPTDLNETTEEGFQQPQVDVCVVLCVGGQSSTRTAQYRTLGDVVFARQALDGEVIGHDYAFVKVPEDDEHMLEPQVPVWQGPTEERSTVLLGEQVTTYGQGLVFGDAELDTRTGTAIGEGFIGSEGSWTAAIPILPGDSGGPAMTDIDPANPSQAASRALGDVTHSLGVNGAPVVGLGMGTLSEQGVAFTEDATGLDIELVTAEDAFPR